MKLLDFERQGLLFPLLVVAAIGVIILSAVSTAAIVGWIPAAQSEVTYGVQPKKMQRPSAEQKRAPAAAARSAQGNGSTVSKAVDPERPAPIADRQRTSAALCADCATVMSVQPVEIESEPSGFGAVAGGVVGGVIGNRIGNGTGRAIATIAGIGGGAYAGHAIEREINHATRYRVVVRTDAGRARTFTEETARWQAGDRVTMHGGRLQTAAASH